MNHKGVLGLHATDGTEEQKKKKTKTTKGQRKKKKIGPNEREGKRKHSRGR